MLKRQGRALGCALFVSLLSWPAHAEFSVTTHHYDNFRTGWNARERALTPDTVSGGNFGLIASIPLDDQVDAQPLVVSNTSIGGRLADVVYVATENNSIYAVAADSGKVLLHANFGAPVPRTALPGKCDNNGPKVGITGTPVVDASASLMYVIIYTFENMQPIYRLHALDLQTLTDRIPPIVVSASGPLEDGQTYTFDPAVSRQRAALLLSNGNVYAAFASFCDVHADLSRGWVLGWQAGTLAPLAGSKITNLLASAPYNSFLTSVWMSGNGLAADAAGNIYFVTGNTDRSGATHDASANPSESVIQMASDLSAIESYFSPANADGLDIHDGDFGSGGVLLLPPQAGAPSNLAVAAGKFGQLYLMNSDNLLNPNGGGSAYGNYSIGRCWCGESYYQGNDGIGRIVSSGASAIGVWRVVTSPAPGLTFERSMQGIANGQDPGFFTSVSSNGTAAQTAIVWAIGRPTDNNPAYVDLYAFDPTNGNALFSAVAGSWPNTGGNANIVPVVANGHVYVATDQALAIFGLGAHAGVKLAEVTKFDTPAPLEPGEHEVYATVRDIHGDRIEANTRNGQPLTVDAADARRNFLMAKPTAGHALLARGSFDAARVLHANTILHAKDNAALWPADR